MSAPTLLPLNAFAQWLAQGERGISSETIVSHLTGQKVGRSFPSHPHDPADLRRCELLLRQVPLARLMFPSMRSASPVWARLVDAWDDLVELMIEEVPDVFEHADGSAPRTYARMRELIEPSYVGRHRA